MPRIGFEAPDSIREVVDLLNRSSGRLELTVVSTAGIVYGHYQEETFCARMGGSPGTAMVYQGEVDDPAAHPLFTAESDEDAVCFLYGLFFGIFGGKSLEDIQDYLQHHRGERLY